MADPWQILGITPGAPQEAVRAAYLRLVRLHHPDRFREDPIRYRQEEERMKEITSAYRQIITGKAAAPAPSPRPRPRPRPVNLQDLQCRAHGRWAVIFCTVCDAPLCSRCDPSLSGLCPTHRHRSGL